MPTVSCARKHFKPNLTLQSSFAEESKKCWNVLGVEAWTGHRGSREVGCVCWVFVYSSIGVNWSSSLICFYFSLKGEGGGNNTFLVKFQLACFL